MKVSGRSMKGGERIARRARTKVHFVATHHDVAWPSARLTFG